MSEFRDRLRRQRGDPVGESADAPDGRAKSSAWLRKQLSGSGRARPDATKETRSEAEVAAHAAAKTVGDPTNLESVLTDRGELCFRELRYSEDHRHGDWQLSEIDAASVETLELLARDPQCAGIDLRRAVYLDIETTGLSGGAGTIAFMVALGSFEGGEFRLWQGFLRSPAEEAAMLLEVALRVADADSVVSFFGKSFDRHRLEDKMKLFGIEPPFENKPHLDLYWPLQRLYGRGFGNGRLSTMETRLTGVERLDDLPGSFAPEAWFDYLGGRGHRLEDVFRHNRDDVLSLVVLAAHAGRSMAGARADDRPLSGPAGMRAAGLGRLFSANREFETALEWCDRALRLGSVPKEGELRLSRTELLTRLGQKEAALTELKALVNLSTAGSSAAEVSAEVSARAAIAAAKLLEHHSREPTAALEYCQRGRELALGRLTGKLRARVLNGLDRREERLRGKLPGAKAAEESAS